MVNRLKFLQQTNYVRLEFSDANGHWYAYAADPLVLLVNQERLNEKKILRPSRMDRSSYR